MLSFESSEESERAPLNEERREGSTYERLSGSSSVSGDEESPLSYSQAKAFPSKLRFFNDKRTLILLSSGMALFLVSTLVAAIIGNGTPANRRGSSLLIIVALCIAVVWLGLLYYKYVKARKRYESLVTSQLWREGVFVFESGDIVICSSRPFFTHRMNFDR